MTIFSSVDAATLTEDRTPVIDLQTGLRHSLLMTARSDQVWVYAPRTLFTPTIPHNPILTAFRRVLEPSGSDGEGYAPAFAREWLAMPLIELIEWTDANSQAEEFDQIEHARRVFTRLASFLPQTHWDLLYTLGGAEHVEEKLSAFDDMMRRRWPNAYIDSRVTRGTQLLVRITEHGSSDDFGSYTEVASKYLSDCGLAATLLPETAGRRS